jgi:hypothetical protein
MKKKLAFGLSTLIFSMSVHATDYSACNKVINPFSGGPSYPGGGVLTPYNIEKDGKIKPATGIKEYKFDKEKNQEIITYDLPIFPNVRPDEQLDFSKLKPEMRQRTVIIQRDGNGEIKKITNNFHVKQSDLDKHTETMKKWFEYTYSDKYKNDLKKWQEQWGLEEFQAPIMMPTKSDIHLSIVDGNCRVDRATVTHLMEKDINGHKYVSISYDTKLCRDLSKVIQKHQDKIQKCFDSSVSNDLKKIASDFYKNNQRENPMTNFDGAVGGFQAGIGIGWAANTQMTSGGIGVGYPSNGFSMQLEDQVASLQSNSPFDKTPPIVKAHHLYDKCRRQGLDVFEDEKYWSKSVSNSLTHGDYGKGGQASKQ